MKKSLLSVGAASMMLAMFATGCASGNNKIAVINDHFNNPPERYCIPVKGKEAEAAAQAEAKSMAIRAQALSQNKSLVQYEAVQKWDGKLPQYMLGNSVPFINVSTK